MYRRKALQPTTKALANALPALMSLMAAPELLLQFPLLAEDGLRSRHHMPGQLCRDLCGFSLPEAKSDEQDFLRSGGGPSSMLHLLPHCGQGKIVPSPALPLSL